MDKPPEDSPWLNSVEAGKYLHRSRRFVAREIKAGRLRGAVIGGARGQVLTRKEWCDEWVENRMKPLLLPTRLPRWSGK